MRYGQFCYIWKGLAQDLDSLDREAFSGEGKVCDSVREYYFVLTTYYLLLTC